eukprot:4057451-Prymnesium_polylepis.1
MPHRPPWAGLAAWPAARGQRATRAEPPTTQPRPDPAPRARRAPAAGRGACCVAVVCGATTGSSRHEPAARGTRRLTVSDNWRDRACTRPPQSSLTRGRAAAVPLAASPARSSRRSPPPPPCPCPARAPRQRSGSST